MFHKTTGKIRKVRKGPHISNKGRVGSGMILYKQGASTIAQANTLCGIEHSRIVILTLL